MRPRPGKYNNLISNPVDQLPVILFELVGKIGLS